MMPQRKMGRPPSDNPKDKLLRVRIDKETLGKLEDCAKLLSTNRSDIVRQGIDMMYDSLEK